MLKYAMIGLGQYGGRQVDAFMSLGNQYEGIAINTASNDLAGLERVPQRNRIQLEGNSLGAGKTPQLAARAMQENARELYPRLREVTEQADFTFLIAGLGGGTGTGSLSWFLAEFERFFAHIPRNHIGLMITLPRDSDGAVEKSNALTVLEQIDELIQSQSLGSVLILDNERFYSQFARDHRPGDWREQSNIEIARLFHEVNAMTVEAGSVNFDQQDLKSVLLTSGCLAIGKATLKDLSGASLSSTIQNSVRKGFFIADYKHEEAKVYSLCMRVNGDGAKLRSAEFETLINQNMDSLFPNTYNKYFGIYESQDNTMYTLVGGLGLPDRVWRISEQVKSVKVSQTRSFQADFELPSFLASTPLAQKHTRVSNGNPYESEPVTPNKDNPYVSQSAGTTEDSLPPRKKMRFLDY